MEPRTTFLEMVWVLFAFVGTIYSSMNLIMNWRDWSILRGHPGEEEARLNFVISSLRAPVLLILLLISVTYANIPGPLSDEGRAWLQSGLCVTTVLITTIGFLTVRFKRSVGRYVERGR